MPKVLQLASRYHAAARLCSCSLIQLLLWGLLSSCAHVVKISYSPEAVIHPAFNRAVTIWQGERVELELAPALRGPALNYLVNYDQVLLANAIRQRGLRHEYKVAGKGAPIVVYSKNPIGSPQEKHYPSTGIILGLTAVREERPGALPLLKLYDVLDPDIIHLLAVRIRSQRITQPLWRCWFRTVEKWPAALRRLSFGRITQGLPPAFI
jgi:hypothetical protein